MSVGARYGRNLAAGGLLNLLLAAAWLQCGSDERELTTVQPASEHGAAMTPLEPDWGRCVEIRGDTNPLCIFDPGQPFRLWIANEGADRVGVFVDGAAAVAERYTVPEMVGVGLRISLPPSAREVRLEVPGGHPWSLRLRSVELPDELADEVAEVERLKDRANVQYGSGMAWQSAQALADQAVREALRAGLSSRAVDAALMSVFYLGWHVERPDLAKARLTEVHAVAMSSPQGRGDWEASFGHVLWGSGEVDAAARAYRAASRYAVRMEDERLIIEAMPMYATTLAYLGYFQAAARWSGYALPFVEQGSEHHGQLLETAGWVDLMLKRDGHEHGDALASYERAAQIFGPGGSFPSPRRLGPAQLGMAEAHFLANELEAASVLLRSIDDELLTLDDRAYRHDLELRVRLGLGQDEVALESALAALGVATEEAASPESRWWLAVRRGDVRARLERWEEAASAYREAEAQLDELIELAALGVGRSAAGQSHRASSVGLAGALLALGRPSEALCALREAEGRRTQLPVRDRIEPAVLSRAAAYVRQKAEVDELVLGATDATVSERRRVQERVEVRLEDLREQVNTLLRLAGRHWRRPQCDELTPLHRGELVLGLYPTSDGWLVFTQDEDGTSAARLAQGDIARQAGDDERISLAILEPIEDRLARARRLRVLASGPAKLLDVQLLPWRGRPLLDAITVVYGAELASGPPREWPTKPKAVLIADPTRTLPGAEREIAEVAGSLRRAGYRVQAIPSEEAFAATVGRAVEGANLLHFSGHSHYPEVDEHGSWPPYAGGTPGLASHLVLAGGQHLAVHDISLLASVPEVVVLEGCEAGVLDTGVGGSSLALAFIIGGSRLVIASPDEVGDEISVALGRELYAEVSDAEPFDAAEALRRAQRRLWGKYRDPQTHIGRYRAWVP